MEQYRVTIKDIAQELGLSTATVSNVIHGKTKKISDRTVERVQQKLEESGYIPNMAAVLLAQNSSKIVCVVLSDDMRYDGRMIEDPFVSGMLNYLSKELRSKGYFMMLREEPKIDQIIRYASMWNMAGLILIGYCSVDYERLRAKMHIPFVVVDAYRDDMHHYSDVGIDNIQGGYLAGRYLRSKGHTKIMYLSDNDEDCDHFRYVGLTQAFEEAGITTDYSNFKRINVVREKREKDYAAIVATLSSYTAAFTSSDMYAIEFMGYLHRQGILVGRDFSLIGFDNIPMASYVSPGLTTIAQDLKERSKAAVDLLQELIDGKPEGRQIMLPVHLVERESVVDLSY